MGKFVKRQNAIGWDWYLETDEESSWVSHMVKEYIERLEAENAKLRDAMYSNAKRHALQHMGEDELRIWATQQAEHIKELREVVDIFIHCIGGLHSCYTCPVKGNPYDYQHDWGACDELRDMLVDMGFEVQDAGNA